MNVKLILKGKFEKKVYEGKEPNYIEPSCNVICLLMLVFYSSSMESLISPMCDMTCRGGKTLQSPPFYMKFS